MRQAIRRWCYKRKLRRLLAEIDRSSADEKALVDIGEGVYSFAVSVWIKQCKARAVAIQKRLNNLN